MWRYHPGELEVQQRAGSERIAARSAAMVDDTVSVGARAFLAEQQLVVLASAGPTGQLSASLVLGPPGFARSELGSALTLALGPRAPWDALGSNLAVGAEVGLLAIDLAEARRLRVNGRIARLDEDRAAIRVVEAYPNCPKYIQRRRLVSYAPRDPSGDDAESGIALDEPRLRLIRAADTFFVASRHPERGLDASHRGGPAGFVEVVDPRTLRIPDYQGNGMFMTLGNLVVDDRVGLLFVDFDRGRALQIAGRATVRTELRHWEVAVDGWVEGPLAASAGWEYLGPSRFNPMR